MLPQITDVPERRDILRAVSFTLVVLKPMENSVFEMPQTLGPFRLLRELGAGGMGRVFLAERIEGFSQQVAIKVLYPHLFPEIAEEATEREGRVLATLNHPGIVRMLDICTTESGLRALVMEYVEGVPLDAYCDRNALGVRQRVELLVQVLESVEYAHRHLVIHADLKPENILVTAEGQTRLLDFGVATAVTELGANADPAGDFTAIFASPEQRGGERLTVGSDLYSLGLVARKILEPQSAGDLAAIIGKAVEPNPADRFQSAQEMLEEFKRYLLGYPTLTRPVGLWTRAKKWVLRNRLSAAVGVGLILVLILSAVGVVWQAQEARRKRQLAETQLRELVRLTDVLAGELYGSLQGLAGSEKAQAALLRSAHEAVVKLAAEADTDTDLQMELVAEYDKLARLQLEKASREAAVRKQCEDDLRQERALLSRLPARDGLVLQAQLRMAETSRMLEAVQAQH